MKRKQEIENSISYLTCVLNKLNDKITDNDEYNKAYNRLLIQRAELRKKLTSSNRDKFLTLFKNSWNFKKFKKQEKLISDYFIPQK